MMAKAKLKTTVHVDGRVYGPDDDLSAELIARISNPNVWDGDAPAMAGTGVREHPLSPVLTGAGSTSGVSSSPAVDSALAAELESARKEITDLKAAAADVPTERTSGIPPKGGPGSGRDAWEAYAAEHDVEVPADATREDIMAALDAADVPTE